MPSTPSPAIVAVEWTELIGKRPRHAGRNARLGDHGLDVRIPVARLTAEDGSQGFGFAAPPKKTPNASSGARWTISSTPPWAAARTDASSIFRCGIWRRNGRGSLSTRWRQR
ncbi:MAG: hypothetical protein R2873_01690 [Caldilineaceae bacterium]